jgi:hypothetical protein
MLVSWRTEIMADIHKYKSNTQSYVLKELQQNKKVFIGTYDNETEAHNKVNELLDAGADGVSLEVIK